jgi:hypothetical protein
VALIEITTFRLRDGVDEETFLAADDAARTEFLYQQPGLLRATTARGDEGWAILVLWESGSHADAATAAADGDPASSRLATCLDADSLRRVRYTTLD